MHKSFVECLDKKLIQIFAKDLKVKKSEVIPILEEFFSCQIIGDNSLNHKGQRDLLLFLKAKTKKIIKN